MSKPVLLALILQENLNLKSGIMNYHDYKSCIDACLQCSAICQHCASEDLKENHGMSNCIQLNLECAALCTASASLMSLGSDFSKKICLLCAEACKKCADECSKHDHKHCRECAEACRKCAEMCENM
jgi:hypothetical protein